MERGDDVLGGELFAEGFGEVAHFVQIKDGVFVDPAGELGATVRLLSELGGDLGKFGRVKPTRLGVPVSIELQCTCVELRVRFRVSEWSDHVPVSASY